MNRIGRTCEFIIRSNRYTQRSLRPFSSAAGGVYEAATDSTAGKPSFAVVGIGGVGQITAAHLTKHGYPVSLTTRSDDKIKQLQSNNNTIEVYGDHDQYFAKLDRVTLMDDIEEAIHDRDVIIVCIPCDGHKSIAEKMAPFIHKNHQIVLLPGHTFGALQVYNTIYHHPDAGDIGYNFCVSEFQTSVLAALCYGEVGRVHYLGNKKKVQFGTFPSRLLYKSYPFWNSLYSQNHLLPTLNVLSPSLNNCNATVHPAATIMNAGRIDMAEKFLFYKQGLSPKCAKLVKDVDDERVAICKKLGIEPVETVNEWLHSRYELNCDDLYSFFQESPVHSGVPGPQTLDHRFVTEDIVTGLMPLCNLGDLLGVPTENMRAVSQICKTLVPEYDFEANSRLIKDCDETIYNHLINQEYDEMNEYLVRGKQCSERDGTQLTEEEVDEFDSAGMLNVGKIFEEAEFAEIKAKILSIYNELKDAGHTDVERYYTNLHLTNEIMREIVSNDKILDIVSSVLGDEIRVFSSMIFCKEPGSKLNIPVPWHQDSRYWPLEPLNVVSIWLAIDDVNIKNGAIKFAIGQHKNGYFETGKMTEGDPEFSPQLATSIHPKDLPKESIIYNVMNEGEVSLHSHAIPHCSDPNETESRRCALIVRYCSADTKIVGDAKAMGRKDSYWPLDETYKLMQVR